MKEHTVRSQGAFLNLLWTIELFILKLTIRLHVKLEYDFKLMVILELLLYLFSPIFDPLHMCLDLVFLRDDGLIFLKSTYALTPYRT